MALLKWTLALLLILPAIGAPPVGTPLAAPDRPEPTALACTVSGEGADAGVGVIGGIVAGKGWVESEDAKGVMNNGDRLTLYALETGALGDVTLTSDVSVGSEQPADPVGYWGLSYEARITVPPGKQAAYEKAEALRRDMWAVDMVAVWHKADPEPPWVVGQLLPGAMSEDSEYRDLLAGWLRSRHPDVDEITSMRIEQAVKADINRDGRDEIFLSFRCSVRWMDTEEGQADPRAFDAARGQAGDDCFLKETGRPESRHFSFLVMRRLPGDARQVETVVLDNCPCRTLWAIGFCDLDGDGTAEVLTRAQGIDYSGAQLFHWDGERFHELDGYGAGV